jgi:hypothetical protein
MLRDFLRKAGIGELPQPTDQTYFEATVDNALLDRDRLIGRITDIAESSQASNETLRAGIARVRSSIA